MSLFGLFERRTEPIVSGFQSGLNNPAYPLTSPVLLDFLGGLPVDSGIPVSELTALRMSAVYRCVSLTSSVSAALPLKTYDDDNNVVSTLLLANPHPELTPYELWRLSYVHRCLWGNSYQQKIRNKAGRVQWLMPIVPNRVMVGRVKPSSINPTGKVFGVTDEWGTQHGLTTRDIFHIPGLGYDGICGVSPVRVAAQSIGLGLAAESYAARLFGSGNLMSGMLQTEQRLAQGDAERLQSQWQAMMMGLKKAHRIAVLDSGASFQNLTMPNKDAQMLESREFQLGELCRFFGVPPALMFDVAKSTSWGTAIEQQAIGWVGFDLHPTWLAPTEQRITKELTSAGIDARYDVDGLLRGDSVARAAYYTAMRNVGAFTANDIRKLEGMPDIPGGDTLLTPTNYSQLGLGDIPPPTVTNDPT